MIFIYHTTLVTFPLKSIYYAYLVWKLTQFEVLIHTIFLGKSLINLSIAN